MLTIAADEGATVTPGQKIGSIAASGAGMSGATAVHLNIFGLNPVVVAGTPEQKARVEKIMRMGPEKNAPLAVFLASDAAREVSGQVFAPRMNELFLFNQSRPIRSIHSAEDWTPERIAEIALPAFRASLAPLDRSGEVFSWDPV